MQTRARHSEDGYLLIGLVVALFLIVLALSVAAPRVAKELEREREIETTHRAQQYVRAIQLYYRRTGAYPNSVEQLVKGVNNIKFLRQQYKDPITGDDFRLIHVGEAKTQVKGFFGEALQGVSQGNLGTAAGMVSSPGGSPPMGTAGGTAGATGSTSSGGFSLGINPPSSPTGAPSGIAGTSTPGAPVTGSGTNDATTFQGSKGAFLGVGSNGKGAGLIEWNGVAEIHEWEFLYDLRVELLKQKVSLFGGTPAASGTGSLGSGFNSPGSNVPGINAPATASPPQTAAPTQTAPSTNAAPQP